MFIRLFYALLYICSLVESKIEIRDANVAALDRDEIGMIFYITVENTNMCSYEVKVNMMECTEVITSSDSDSSFMHLIGGHMGVLKPHCFKNLTALYPNMYVHNRRGWCLLSIKFKSDKNEIIQKKANISFDTWMTKHGAPTVMRGFFRKGDLPTCSSVDQDPLNHCKPVDCHMKYLGTRNFFNKKWQRCQKVPFCLSDPRKDLPDVIFSPSTNKCRDMERSVTRTDLESIESGMKRGPCDEPYTTLVYLNCHFGRLNNQTGLCDCNDGWMSAPMDKDRGQAASLMIYHMCNIEASDWYDNNSRIVKLICLIIGILAVVIAMIVILCSFLIQQLYDCIKKYENDDVEKSNKSRSGSFSSNTSKSSRTSKCSRTSKSSQTSKTSKSTEASTSPRMKRDVTFHSTRRKDRRKGL